MPNGPTAAWLEQFASRLLQSDPTTTPLDAVRHAVESFPGAAGIDPREAANLYSAGERSGKVGTLSMMGRHTRAMPQSR